jgi:tRNA modification GTPase
MFDEDTITAISTAPGVGAIAIVRVSGQRAFAILGEIFSERKNKTTVSDSKNNFVPESHRAYIGYIKDPSGALDPLGADKIIDEVVVVTYRGPNTYTGEDLVEINCHGSPVVTREILNLVMTRGARLAEKGEFTKRGFLAGRLDLTQAEAVLDVIHCKTERQSHLALSVLQGHLGKRIKEIRSRLMELYTRIVAGIDFPEEVGDLDLADLEPIINESLDELKDLAQTARSGRFLREGLKLAIIGRPNAGKSSLLNRLLNFERAIVTDIPGTTRDSIEEPVDIRGIPVVVIDTAGLRETEDLVEKIGIERTTRSAEEADLTCILLDGTETGPLGEESLMAERLKELARPYFVAVNKCDLLDEKAIAKIKEEKIIAGSLGDPIIISALSGEGIEALKDVIENFALFDNSRKEISASLNERQGALCLKSVEALSRLAESAQAGLPQDCLASDLRLAVDALDAISGQVVTEEILTEVFANFCIGK